VYRGISDEALAERIRGLLLKARGEPAAARTHLERAIGLFQRAGNMASADWVRTELAAIIDLPLAG
jgi:hypothetical protein